MSNEEQRAEKTKFEGEEQDETENSVIGFHNGSVLVLHKDHQNNNCESIEAQGHEAQCNPYGIFISQKCHDIGEAVSSLHVGILMI